MGNMEIDSARFPNITRLDRVGWRSVDAHLGSRQFRVAVYEKLSDRESPIYSADYEERVDVEIGGAWKRIWVRADLPWEASDSVDACLHAALRHVNDA
jgi:hypothetical protein